MADASRFPHLALPFAIVGAAGGWLSAGLVATPLLQRAERNQGTAAVLSAGLAALMGVVIRSWCLGRPEAFRFDTPEPEPEPDRARSDVWWRHAAAVLAAGTLSGVGVAVVCRAYGGAKMGAAGGLACALAFVPVCLAVIAAARRAQRARLGSLVAGSDRRAVWGILATALAVATLEAAPDWPAAAAGISPAPWAATGMLGAAALVIAAVLAVDLRARRRAREALREGLVPQDAREVEAADTRIPRLDLGLGDDIGAQIARTSAAYRGRDRTVALVRGDADQALATLGRAARRGALGLAVVGGVALAHLAASSDIARLELDEDLCGSYDLAACERLATSIRDRHPEQAMILFERACRVSGKESCFAFGEMLSERARDPETRQRADDAFGKACIYGDRRGCLALAR
jgi:hypothetical protein